MSDITLGYIFVPTDGTNRLTSMKLNRLGRGAVINPSFVSSKPAVSGASAGDQFIMLKADGTYARVPATAFGGGGGGGGDMFKAVYDTNGNGIVDNAETAQAVPWANVTGKPATFPPDATAEKVANKGVANGYAALDATGKVPVAELPPFGTGDMTKAVYDTNGNNVVDTCDSLAWGKLTSVPSTFSPSAHASTHLDNGSDPVPVATTLRTGSLRILSGSATQYLDGSGNWSTPAPAGTVNPGTWTVLSYATGWSENTTARYRVETNGAFQKVICEGIVAYASGAAALAFTLPAGARPGVARGCALAGYDSTGDVLLFSANVAISGAVTIYPMVRQAFSWPSATNGNVYLDNLSFAL